MPGAHSNNNIYTNVFLFIYFLQFLRKKNCCRTGNVEIKRERERKPTCSIEFLLNKQNESNSNEDFVKNIPADLAELTFKVNELMYEHEVWHAVRVRNSNEMTFKIVDIHTQRGLNYLSINNIDVYQLDLLPSILFVYRFYFSKIYFWRLPFSFFIFMNFVRVITIIKIIVCIVIGRKLYKRPNNEPKKNNHLSDHIIHA